MSVQNNIGDFLIDWFTDGGISPLVEQIGPITKAALVIKFPADISMAIKLGTTVITECQPSERDISRVFSDIVYYPTYSATTIEKTGCPAENFNPVDLNELCFVSSKFWRKCRIFCSDCKNLSQ